MMPQILTEGITEVMRRECRTIGGCVGRRQRRGTLYADETSFATAAESQSL